MAQGDKKRTYVLTDEGVKAIEWLNDNTRLDRSDAVDRAVKQYFVAVKEGNVDDALVVDETEKRAEEETEGIDDGDDGDGWLSRRLG